MLFNPKTAFTFVYGYRAAKGANTPPKAARIKELIHVDKK